MIFPCSGHKVVYTTQYFPFIMMENTDPNDTATSLFEKLTKY